MPRKSGNKSPRTKKAKSPGKRVKAGKTSKGGNRRRDLLSHRARIYSFIVGSSKEVRVSKRAIEALNNLTNYALFDIAKYAQQVVFACKKKTLTASGAAFALQKSHVGFSQKLLDTVNNSNALQVKQMMAELTLSPIRVRRALKTKVCARVSAKAILLITNQVQFLLANVIESCFDIMKIKGTSSKKTLNSSVLANALKGLSTDDFAKKAHAGAYVTKKGKVLDDSYMPLYAQAGIKPVQFFVNHPNSIHA